MPRIPIACLALALAAGPAAATDPAYEAADVVRFFLKQQDSVRAVCITDTDGRCEEEQNARPGAAFDMLVTFDFNSADLTESARANLSEFARALGTGEMRQLRFRMEGYTDAKGSDAYNLALSQRRAAAVVDYLSSLGVDRAMLESKGYGETNLRDPADPYAPVNRRVETRLR